MTSLLARFDDLLLAGRNDQIVDADRDSRLGSVEEPDLLDLVEELDGLRQPVAEVAIVDELPQPLLLEQAIDEGHVLRQVVVQDHAADGGFEYLVLERGPAPCAGGPWSS